MSTRQDEAIRWSGGTIIRHIMKMKRRYGFEAGSPLISKYPIIAPMLFESFYRSNFSVLQMGVAAEGSDFNAIGLAHASLHGVRT